MHAARTIICEAYKEKMTQKQGYVWFLPGWYGDNWYDLDALRQDTANGTGCNSDIDDLNSNQSINYQQCFAFLPNCTTSEMVEVSLKYCIVYKTFYV